jgi:hypothetical protein
VEEENVNSVVPFPEINGRISVLVTLETFKSGKVEGKPRPLGTTPEFENVYEKGVAI